MTGTILQPELGGAVPFRVDTVPDAPDQQVAITINLMRRYALESAATPELRRDLELARQVGNGDVIAGIHALVRRGLRFRNDDETASSINSPHNATTVEVLVAPVDLSRAIEAGRQPAEDCDGFSMYCAALLYAAGIPCGFVTVAADPLAPGQFTHVYSVAWPDQDTRVPVDASHGDYAGWECPNRYGRRIEWPLVQPRHHPVIIAVLLVAAAWFATRKARVRGE